MDLSKYLAKQFSAPAAKTAFVSFGEFNPPTAASARIISETIRLASKTGAKPFVFLSRQQDTETNPLSYELRESLLDSLFDVAVLPVKKLGEYGTFIESMAALHEQGVLTVNVLVWKNDLLRYEALAETYVGPPMRQINIIPMTVDEPDSSMIRECARAGYKTSVRKMLPEYLAESTDEIIDGIRAPVISEGVYDKGIFKAIWVFGGPGSGKDFVLGKALGGSQHGGRLSGLGLVEMNKDQAFEYLMKKRGLSLKMPDSETPQREIVRADAMVTASHQRNLAIEGRRGIIINGTAENQAKTEHLHNMLSELGYEHMAVFVDTSNETSRARNIARGERGGRTVPEEVRQKKWAGSQAAKDKLKAMFGADGYIEYDNNDDLRTVTPEKRAAKEAELAKIFKKALKFVEKPVNSQQQKTWVNDELSKKDRSGLGNPYHDRSGQFTDKTHAVHLGPIKESAFIRYKRKRALAEHK